MLAQLIPSLRATLLIATLTGLIFPALMTGICQLLFAEQASGSLIKNEKGEVIGSRIIGQAFNRPQYFQGRPSAAGSGYSGEASGGSNLGPCSSKLIEGIADDPASKEKDESFAGIKQLSEKYRLENLLSDSEKVPVDAVTRSGCGLDPHISTYNAGFQARRVAKARSLEQAQLKQLIDKYTENRQLGFLGEPRVNVLLLNIELDKLAKKEVSSSIPGSSVR